MKKLLCMVLVVVMIMSLAGCKARTVHTTDTFTEVMEGRGFTVYDVTETTDMGELKATALVAVGDKFQVELWTFETNKIAGRVFDNNRRIAENVTSTSHASVSSGDYDKYTQTTSEMYWFIARVENTFIYCVADKEYKDTVIDIMKELDVK